MKVLFLTPPKTKSKYKSHPFLQFTAPPLGLAYMAAVLEQEGHDVRILDSLTLEYDYNQVKRYISKYSPDIVGIQAYTPSIYNAVKTAEIVKEVDNSIITVLGGPHPTLLPEDTINMSNAIDYILRGEAEYTFRDFVNLYEKGEDVRQVRGLTYRHNGQIVHNPDAPLIKNLDELPFPARHLLPMDKYRIFGIKVPGTTMISSRGCPFHCDFCVVSAFYKRRWRGRSPKNIVDEMEFIKNTYKYMAIAFVDDLFAVNRKRVYDIVNEIRRRKLDVIWGATIRGDLITKDMLKRMFDAGCVTLFIGVESGDQKILDKIEKGTTLEHYKRVFKWAKEIGIDIIASFALGFPWDTPRSIKKTIDFAVELDPDHAIFSLATPYPGTKFYNEALNKGMIKVHDWSYYNLFRPIIETTGITVDQYKDILAYAYKRFYMRPGYLAKRVIKEAMLAIKIYGVKLFLKNAFLGFLPLIEFVGHSLDKIIHAR